jgi:hypothetical protein
VPIAAAIAAVVAWLALVVPYLIAPGVRLDFDEDSPAPLAYARGLSAPEHTADQTFVWAGPNARLLLPAVPRSTPWTLTIAARAPRPAGAVAAPVTISERGRQLTVVRFAPAGDALYAAVDVELPAAAQPGVRVEIVSGDAFSPGPHDSRQLALQIDAIVLRPANRFAAIPWLRATVAAAAFGVLAFVVGLVCGGQVATWGAVAAAVAIGALGHTSSWLYQPSFAAIYGAAWLVLAVLGVGAGLRWAWGLAPDAADPAMAVTVWFTVAKFALLIHPSMTIGDCFFHQNRSAMVDAGNYYLTSGAPGGDFPYPVAFYVVLTALSSGPVSVDLMRGVALLADSVAGLVVAFAVASSARAATMALVVALWQTAPALFQVQALAYVTNSFGNSWSAITAALLIRGARPGAALWLVAAVAAALVTNLSHVSSAVLLMMALAVVVALATLARRWRLAVAALVVIVVSAGVAWGAYYRHYDTLYAPRTDPTAATADPAPAALPVQRAEAHQTVYAPGWPALRQRLAFVPFYVAKYVGAGLLTLSLLAAWWQYRSRLALDDAGMVALGIAAAVAVAFAFGQLSAIDLRYYLVAAALCAPVAAVAVTATPASVGGRRTCQVLASLAIVQGCWYMVRFLGTPLPR